MADTTPSKVETDATAVHNPHGVRPDRLVASYACATVASAQVPNLGKQAGNDSEWPAFGDNATLVNGVTLSEVDADDPSLVFVKASSQYMTLYTNSSGSDKTLTRGAILLRFKCAVPGASANIIFNTHDGNAAGRLGIQQLPTVAGGHLRLTLKDAVPSNVDLQFTMDSEVFWGGWQTLLVRWGPETGFTATLNSGGVVTTKSDPCTDPVIIYNGKTISIGHNNTTLYADMLLGYAGMLDKAVFSDWDILKLLTDPCVPIRTSPSATAHFGTVGPIAGCVTADSIQIGLTTGRGDAGDLATDAVGFKVQYGTNPYELSDISDAVVVTAITDINRQLIVPLTGLTAGTEYWYRAFWTPQADAGTPVWYPVPWGLLRFRTMRASIPVGGLPVNITADSHAAQVLTRNPRDVGVGLDLVNAATDVGQWVAYAAWRAEQDMASKGLPDFTIDLGDGVYCDKHEIADNVDDVVPGMFEALDSERAMRPATYGAGAVFCVGGNHDGQMGFYQSADQGDKCALQRQALYLWQQATLNPGPTTYPEGGENEGGPGALDAVAPDPRPSWMPTGEPFASFTGGSRGATNTGQTGYDNEFNRMDADRAAYDGRNGLHNYYAFTVAGGHTLFVALDTGRYTEPGDPDNMIGNSGVHRRLAPSFTLGAVQLAWLTNLLATNTAKFTVICAHQWVGSDLDSDPEDLPLYYGRGDDPATGGPIRAQLHNVLKQYANITVLHGHDHIYSPNDVKDGVTYISIGTMSAPSHVYPAQAEFGWHTPVIQAIYGTAEDLGAGVRDLTHWSVGYCRLLIEEDQLTFTYRQTNICYGAAGAPLVMTNVVPFAERYVGEERAADTTNNHVDNLDEAPRDVGFAIEKSDWDTFRGLDSWDDTSTLTAAGVQSASPPGSATDEDHADAVDVPLADIDETPVRVLSVPRDLDVHVVQYATPATHLAMASVRNTRPRSRRTLTMPISYDSPALLAAGTVADTEQAATVEIVAAPAAGLKTRLVIGHISLGAPGSVYVRSGAATAKTPCFIFAAAGTRYAGLMIESDEAEALSLVVALDAAASGAKIVECSYQSDTLDV